MKVKAIRDGYYGHQYRHEGKEFSIKNEKEFSKKWMELVDEEAPKKGKAKKEVVVEETEEAEDVI